MLEVEGQVLVDRAAGCDRFSLLRGQAFLHAHANGAGDGLVIQLQIVSKLAAGAFAPFDFGF
jgi:hypothetical protein